MKINKTKLVVIVSAITLGFIFIIWLVFSIKSMESKESPLEDTRHEMKVTITTMQSDNSQSNLTNQSSTDQLVKLMPTLLWLTVGMIIITPILKIFLRGI
jgi:Ca2+/Na+ antiporter